MTLLLWVGFLLLIATFLALDLGVFHRKARVVSGREALAWTAVWVTVALGFNALVYVMYEHNWLGIAETLGVRVSGRQAALEFFTGYLIEESLSLDNVFVIAMIFAYFRVPPEVQHRVLFWGIIGAQLMRGAMIALGLAFIELVAWAIYVLGGLLLVTAFRMLSIDDEKLEPDKNPLVRLVRRVYPVTPGYDGDKFFVRRDGRTAATPLLLALVVVESMDLLFAIDSIPAVMAVTLDPFIVFTSNVFAILGLRSLYFALAAVMSKFRYLKVAIVAILAFVGIKMLLSHHYRIPTLTSLAVIAVLLLLGVAASLVASRRVGPQRGARRNRAHRSTAGPRRGRRR